MTNIEKMTGSAVRKYAGTLEIVNESLRKQRAHTEAELTAANDEIERLRGRVSDLEIGLLKFCGQAEFKKSVCGTMGHFQSAYDYAQRLRQQAEDAEKGGYSQ